MMQLRWMLRRIVVPVAGTMVVWLAVVPVIAQNLAVAPGIDGLTVAVDALAGRRIGIVTNHAAVTRDGRSTAVVLTSLPDAQVTAFFAPEHGLNGSGLEVPAPAVPPSTPVYSLFGRVTQPTRKMLSRVDVLVIDLQDVGVRPFTYASTMALVMEAARETGKQVVVLDRPNPMGGLLMDGPVLEPQLSSFIGMYPIPYVHGMTIGELAQLYNRGFGIGANLRVVPMRGWSRRMLWADTGLQWTIPSPGLLTDDSPFYYATTGAIDGTNLWNGVTTESRFRVILAPWIDGDRLADRLNQYGLPGVVFAAAALPHPVTHRLWSGVRLFITDPSVYRPSVTAVYVLVEIRKMYKNRFAFWPPWRGSRLFDSVWGTRQVRLAIQRGDDAATIVSRWQPGLQQFLALRDHYLLYPDVPLSSPTAGVKPADAGRDGTPGPVFPLTYRGVRE